MKYLQIHKLLWILIILIYTACDVIVFCIMYLGSILWHFKLPDWGWADAHNDEDIIWEDKYVNGVKFTVARKSNQNAWESLKARYHLIF